MSNKFYVRNQPTISRDLDARESPSKQSDWFKEFADNLAKSSTTSRKEQNSTFDQINRIMGNKTRYSSVSEAVLDMQKRTGLYDLLRKKAQESTVSQVPSIFSEIPDMKVFIDNFVEDRPGIAVEAVVHALLRVQSIKSKLKTGDDVPDDVKHYINSKIAETSHNIDQTSSGQLGKLDIQTDDKSSSADNDPFQNFSPFRNK